MRSMRAGARRYKAPSLRTRDCRRRSSTTQHGHAALRPPRDATRAYQSDTSSAPYRFPTLSGRPPPPIQPKTTLLTRSVHISARPSMRRLCQVVAGRRGGLVSFFAAMGRLPCFHPHSLLDGLCRPVHVRFRSMGAADSVSNFQGELYPWVDVQGRARSRPNAALHRGAGVCWFNCTSWRVSMGVSGLGFSYDVAPSTLGERLVAFAGHP